MELIDHAFLALKIHVSRDVNETAARDAPGIT